MPQPGIEIDQDAASPSEREALLAEVRAKSLAGVGALFYRQIFTKLLFLVGSIVLARLLTPQVFGVFAIVSFVIQFFSTFSDVGLGVALIQKKGDLSEEETSTTFWVQQAMVFTVGAILVAAAPLALKVYPTLPPAGVWLIRVMAVSFLFSSLKTIPAILMERRLDFRKIAWVDILESVLFYGTAIGLAFAGFEVWSFVYATILRSAAGAALIYVLSPWRPSFRFRYDSVRALIQFGIPYQINGILCFVKDAVTPLFVGAYAGAAAVGYVTWARTFAFAPLVLTEGFGRVAFPAFSRIQDEKELLAQAVERSIRCLTLVMFPITAILLGMGTELTRLVFTEKWMPGIPAFYLYCTSPGLIGVFLPLFSAILSLGKSDVLIGMTVLLVALEWGLGVPFVVYLGYNAVALTQPITAILFTCLYLFVLRREDLKIRVIVNIRWHGLGAILLLLFIMGVKRYVAASILHLMGIGIVGLSFYIGFLILLQRPLVMEFRDYARTVVLGGK